MRFRVLIWFGVFQVDNNGAAPEKTTPGVENSKEVCMPATAAADPGECSAGDAPTAGDGATSGKTEAAATQAVAVTAPPIPEGRFSAH